MIKINFIFYRSIALRTLSMNLPDQRAGDKYTQAGRAKTVADIEHSTSQTTWTRKVQATVLQCLPKIRMGCHNPEGTIHTNRRHIGCNTMYIIHSDYDISSYLIPILK